MKSYSKLLAVALAAVLAFALVGCSQRDVAAKVNGEVIKKSDVDAQLDQMKKQYPDLFKGADAEARAAEYRERIVDNMVNLVLLRQEAEKQGIKVSDKQINEQFSSLKKGFPNQEAFQAALKRAGLTEEKLKEQLRDQMVTQAMVEKLAKQIKVTDKDMKAYYEKNQEQFKERAAVHAAHILFDKKDKNLAQDVLGQVKNGGDFAALAKKYSKDQSSAVKGGDLGWPTGPYVQQFQQAADQLNPGQISELVESPFGWHIIKVIEKRKDRVKPYSEVQDQVKLLLQQERRAQVFNEFITKLKKDAKIDRPKVKAVAPKSNSK